MQPGARLASIDGQPVATWDALRTTVARGAPDRPFEIVVERLPADAWDRAAPAGGVWDAARGSFRGAERVALSIQGRQKPRYTLGLEYTLAPEQVEIRADSFGEALRTGAICSVDLIKQIYVILKRLFTGDVAAKNLSGVVGISTASYQVAKAGPSRFFYWLALLSLNLAFLNVLPIPVLDGGHLLFLVVEKIKGSPVSTRVLGYSQVLGLIFVLALVVFVTYNDIRRLL
jgi:regulator of sigma E protease